MLYSPKASMAHRCVLLFTVSLVLILIGSVVYRGVFSKSLATTTDKLTFTDQQSIGTTHTHYQPEGTIDGSVNPELIPDSKAYSLFFRILSKRTDERGKLLTRTFIKTAGVSDQDINALLAASSEFNQSVGQLDAQAMEIKQYNHSNPSPAVLSQLNSLDQQKEAIVTNLILSLPRRLSKESLENLRNYMSGQFKRQMKIVPAR